MLINQLHMFDYQNMTSLKVLTHKSFFFRIRFWTHYGSRLLALLPPSPPMVSAGLGDLLGRAKFGETSAEKR